MNFDLDAQTRVALGMELAKFLNSYFSTLPDREVQPPIENRKFDPLTNALPDQGTIRFCCSKR